ncbi:MAG: discoidin domain-containing protein, partial [Calditrichaceae bacterium]
MYKIILKPVIWLVVLIFLVLTSCTSVPEKSKDFTVQITDSPKTFCNPLNLYTGSQRVWRAGEAVVVLHQDDYYLFITGGRGYWYSDNLRDWTYVKAPDFPGGCPSVISDGETMYASGDKTLRDVFASTDPKNGVWEKVGHYDRDYGDADMFLDDDGRLYMYWGWSQILPFQVVELDPKNNFSEIGEPVTLFFGNEEEHGWERRRNKDVIFPFFSHRPYFAEASPWIEGPWMIKHNGKYYLQYAAIGPALYGEGRGGGDIALYPTSVDAEGVMHSNTAFGDYPQYYPGIKENPVDNNFTGWMLLSHKKYAKASSTLKGYDITNAVDENLYTFWCAETGDPGEFMVVDLGKECDIYAMQVNFDQHDAKVKFVWGRGMVSSSNADDNRFRSYTVETSTDNKNWSLLIDKSNNTKDVRYDYTELHQPVKARYVKLTNVFTPFEGKFAVKDLRIFGNPQIAEFTEINNVMVARDADDPRNAVLTWQPVKNADGYVIRYGIEPGKLYNDHIVYDAYTLNM